jgi:histone acetyltransferase (RNA polymerase elongator complex component)
LNRIIRDIPNDYSLLKDYYSNIRQDAADIVHKDGWHCSCIRCREVKNGIVDYDKMVMRIRMYNASGGDEYFISLESDDPHGSVLYGFVRLRLTRNQATHVFKELAGCAMIRELHVYGQLKSVTKNLVVDQRQNQRETSSTTNSYYGNTWNGIISAFKSRFNKGTDTETATKDKNGNPLYENGKSAQHLGFGKRLMMKAEEIARNAGYYKMSVISGEGTRGYYKKLGYVSDNGLGGFMIKNL